MNTSVFSRSLMLSIVLLTAHSVFAQTKKTAPVTTTQEPVKNDPVLMTIGNSKVTITEFKNVYDKNRSKETASDAKALNDYVDLFVNFKLKVKEAEELGLDTVKSFKDELAGYRKQLAQPYLTDKDVNEKLLRETYDRMAEDIHAAHILVKVTESALPKDTLEA